MTHGFWPMKTPPRSIAQHAVDELQRRKPASAEETWRIIDEIVAMYPGAHVDIVRSHVHSALMRGLKPKKSRA